MRKVITLFCLVLSITGSSLAILTAVYPREMPIWGMMVIAAGAILLLTCAFISWDTRSRMKIQRQYSLAGSCLRECACIIRKQEAQAFADRSKITPEEIEVCDSDALMETLMGGEEGEKT